jgi:PHD/YefM family antitoxin component YafN of YafNO toxin-antitoxin module
VNGRYVVDENGERVAVLLDIEDYERMVANHRDPAAEDEPLDPEEAEDSPDGGEYQQD